MKEGKGGGRRGKGSEGGGRGKGGGRRGKGVEGGGNTFTKFEFTPIKLSCLRDVRLISYCHKGIKEIHDRRGSHYFSIHKISQEPNLGKEEGGV